MKENSIELDYAESAAAGFHKYAPLQLAAAHLWQYVSAQFPVSRVSGSKQGWSI